MENAMDGVVQACKFYTPKLGGKVWEKIFITLNLLFFPFFITIFLSSSDIIRV